LSKGFLISAITVTNPERYAEYRQLSTEAMQGSGGRILVRGGNSHVLEGTFAKRIVVVEFDNFEAAQEFYHSADYLKARTARGGAAEVNMVVVDGV
jgi:uncharacterized protein (DUF1330 family)